MDVLRRAAVVTALLTCCQFVGSVGRAQAPIPLYAVDPSWPKPLPNQWVLGGLGGVCVDAQDHVLILNRQDVLEGDLNAGTLAPSIIEFDPDGTVVNAWGDPELLDPRLHSCHFDPDGNVWIASAPSGMVQKYSHGGRRLLLQIGTQGALDSSDGTAAGTPLNSPAARFYAPSSVFVDREDGSVYVADGESVESNRRVAVMDSVGRFLRQWLLTDMDSVHCMAMARDGTVYVCNRFGSRIQLYDKIGTPMGQIEVPWMPVTPRPGGEIMQIGGPAVALDFSSDSDQRLLFVINQNNARVDIIERETGTHLGSFGRLGNFPGEFNQPHGIAVDSEGNVYIAENRGRRVHKFRIVSE